MSQQTNKNVLLRLFFSTLYISAFTFGGGFVIITFMKRKFCDELHWLEEQEMLDIAALAQSSPGAIAVNAAILVGIKVAGAAGMAVAVLGTVIPPLVILSFLSFIYEAFSANIYVALMLKGMQAGVAAVLLDVVCNLGGKLLKSQLLRNLLLMAAAFIAAAVCKINVIYIILAAIGIGLLTRSRAHKKPPEPDPKKEEAP
ncbi:MAG: chromate transporter [Candidatus Gastranaerophilales bacterium]|nr:chromate transporter [Candidatus Gastranaerophilales bacterium]